MTRRDSLEAVTIATVEARVTAVLLTLFLGFWAGTWVTDASHHASMASEVIYLVIAAAIVIGGCVRGWRLGLHVNDDGVTVRNFFRTHQFGWPEVRCFADGSALGAESQHWWALRVVLRDGRTVTARGTTRSGPPNSRMLATIRTAAARYGMSAELTGVAARRPSLNGTKQRQSPASAQWRAANAATLPDWAPARKFSITRLRPGYDQEQVDAFVEAIRDTFLGVREPPLKSDEIRNKQFSTTRLRPGYDEEEVDAFLDEAETRLAALSGRPSDNVE